MLFLTIGVRVHLNEEGIDVITGVRGVEGRAMLRDVLLDVLGSSREALQHHLHAERVERDPQRIAAYEKVESHVIHASQLCIEQNSVMPANEEVKGTSAVGWRSGSGRLWRRLDS